MKYEKILLDLDNTLIDDDENKKYAFKKILEDRKIEVTEEKLENFVNIDKEFWDKRSKGEIKDPYEFKTKEEKTKWVRAQIFLICFKDISFEEASNINDRYIEYLKESIIPIENSQEILKYLKEKGYKIYIITNGPISAARIKISSINASNYIEDIFSAEYAGHMKPHNVFYNKFFESINCYETDKMIAIGDDLYTDIKGGIDHNIDTCWFNINNIKINDNKYKPKYEIQNLIELKNIL